MNEKYIVVFDGICNFCNFWVNFIIDRDKHDKFRFTSLQSPEGEQIVREANLGTISPDTFILKYKNSYMIRSTAGLTVAKELGFPMSLLYPLILVPHAIRDMAYNLIAKNRYKLFGKSEVCRLPNASERAKFL